MRTAFAQAAPSDNSILSKLVPRPERLEGAVSVSRRGITTRATLRFQAPDLLRVDVQRDEAIGIVGASYFSRGVEAQSVEADGRVRRWRFGSARQPWRSDALADGGPANLTLFGWPQGIEQVYDAAPVAKTAGGEITQTWTARAGVGARMVADGYRSGDLGSQFKGGLIYFNTFKRTVYDRPFRLVLRLSASGALLSREDRDETNRVLKRTDFERDAASGALLGATVRDAGKRLVETWKYDLKPRAEAFPEGTFDLPDAAKQQVVEDAEPMALSDYAGESADALWNKGNVLWRQAEELRAAMAAWDAAARLKPQAVSPPMAIFDAALRSHDMARAQSAVSRLAQLRGATDFAVLLRRANLEIARRDWSAAKEALDAAQRAQPLNLSITLTRADLARGSGDDATARALLSEIVSSAAQQPEVQAGAAEALASLLGAGHEGSASERDAAFALLPKTPATLAGAAATGAATGATEWQKLARAHLSLMFGQGEGDAAQFKDLFALSSLARGQERAGHDDAAVASWQIVAARAPGTLSASGTPGTWAREHLVALQAKRGDVQASLRAYRALVAQAPDETARERARDILISAWHKNFRGGELRIALKQIATTTNAPEDDLRLWLAWQERYSPQSEIEATIRGGAKRFGRSAWWHWRYSDFLAQKIPLLPEVPDNTRAQNSLLAQAEASRAAKIDVAQPFYAAQVALTWVQRAVILRRSVEQDLTAQSEADAAAVKALNDLERAWPDDPDVALVLASGRDALVSPSLSADASVISGLDAALRRGAPIAAQSSERHAAVFFGRQILSQMLARARRFDEATVQFEILFDAARNATEAAGIATTEMLASQKRGDVSPAALAGAGARLLRRLSSEWPLEESDESADIFAEAILRISLQTGKSPGAPAGAEARMLFAKAVSAILQGAAPNAPTDREDMGATSGAASIVAAAHLHFAMQRLAARQLALPDAPAAWDRFNRESSALVAASVAALTNIANGTDPMLAPRAAALLEQDAIARNDWNAAAQWLAIAIRGEPQSLELRALQTRLQLAMQKPADALATRNAILRALPPNADVLRRVGVLSASLNLPDDAARYASQALNVAQTTREVSIAQTQAIAFSLAHIFLAQGQFDRAAPLYTGLSADQWPLEDRLAALLDWEARLRAAEKADDAARVRAQAVALKYTEEDLATAQNILRTLQ